MGTGFQTVPTKPKPANGGETPKRNDVPAKVDAEVIRIAKTVAAFRGLTLAEYLSERLRPLVNEDFDAMHRSRR